MNVRRVTTPRDAASAATLIHGYRRWMEVQLGTTAEESAPHMLPELDAPAEHYARVGGGLLLASTPGRGAGVVAVRPDDADGAEIKRLFVRRESRGSGAGRVLLEAAIDVPRRGGGPRRAPRDPRAS